MSVCKCYESKRRLPQGDIEKRTGLLRCYISRVENGHTVPAIDALEKMARALGMPLYQVLYDGDKPPQERVSAKDSDAWALRRALDAYRKTH